MGDVYEPETITMVEYILTEICPYSVPIGIVLALIIELVQIKRGKAKKAKDIDDDPFLVLTLKCVGVVTLILLLFVDMPVRT